MLPAGMAVDPLPSAELAGLRALLPAAQTVAQLRVGACSCDLVRPRLPETREDERHLSSTRCAFATRTERFWTICM